MYTSNHKLGNIFKYPKLNKYQGLMGDIPIRAGTTYVGVEIEIEKTKSSLFPAGTWQKCKDGSLKEDGHEYITIPIQFKYLEIELQRLFDCLKTSVSTIRCSTHVHLNVRDFTYDELHAFLLLYLIFEKSLFNFSGSRGRNNFCVPLYTTHGFVYKFIRELKISGILEYWYKYTALNLCPIWGGDGSSKIGTIEFRHMEGTKDIKYIINWINLIVSLKISAKKIPLSTIYEYLETMNTTSAYTWLTQIVFTKFSNLIIEQPSFKEDVEFCITATKEQVLDKMNIAEEILIIKKKGL